MVGIPPLGIEYAAWPPEFNTFRLQLGAGPVPMLEAAAGWEAWAVSLEAQAAELAASLSTLSGAWSGMASERAVAATMPMVLWLQTTAAQFQKRAMQALAQAESYTTAATTTPQLPEIAQNHITHGVLESTNFLGVNTVPIGMNEADYIRMWILAADTMYAYLAETTTNMLFEPVMPMQPMVVPGVTEAGVSGILAQAAAFAPAAAARDAVFAGVTGQSIAGSVGLKTGQGQNLGVQAGREATSQASHVQNAQPRQQETQGPQQFMSQGLQMVSQFGSQAAQLPMQLLSNNPVQELSQPLQQVMSTFTSMGGSTSGDHGIQAGLLGAQPFSNHPMAGGSGAATGAGLVRAASLPGMGGSAPRTPLMAKLIDKVDPITPAAVEPVGAAAGASATAGAAPVGSGSGGAGPMGMTGQRGKSGGSKSGLKAPAPLAQDLGEDEGDDW